VSTSTKQRVNLLEFLLALIITGIGKDLHGGTIAPEIVEHQLGAGGALEQDAASDGHLLLLELLALAQVGVLRNEVGHGDVGVELVGIDGDASRSGLSQHVLTILEVLGGIDGILIDEGSLLLATSGSGSGSLLLLRSKLLSLLLRIPFGLLPPLQLAA
jgi:hypothetical protein